MDTPKHILNSSRSLSIVSALFNFTQLVLDIVCVGIALWDIKDNFLTLLTYSGMSLLRQILPKQNVFLSQVLGTISGISSAEIGMADQLSGRILVTAITISFVITSYVFIVWYIVSLLSRTVGKTLLVVEVIYQSTGFMAHLLASSALFVQIKNAGTRSYINREWMLVLAALVMANATLYLLDLGLTLLLCRRIRLRDD